MRRDSDLRPSRHTTTHNSSMMSLDDSILQLSCYLEQFLTPDLHEVRFPRVECCGSSKSLYCTECLTLLIDPSHWPTSILHGKLKLPFDLDIILDDRRRSCSSLHAMVLLRASCSSSTLLKDDPVADESLHHSEPIQLIDLQREDNAIPSYIDHFNSTYLLFPSSDSIPLSSVADKVSKLIVLDCKWTKCNTLPKELQTLNKVRFYPIRKSKNTLHDGWGYSNKKNTACIFINKRYI
jgi:hypothetical protein